MDLQPLPFTNGFYRSESLPVSAQQCINAYTVIAEAPSLVPEFVVGIPGLDLLVSSGVSQRQCHGGHVMDGVPYFVNGEYLYRLNSDSTLTNLGFVEGDTGVSIADNGFQLCIMVPGGAGYIYNATTDVFVEITDSDFRANGEPQYVAFVDGYFVFTTDEKKFIISALNDGLSYNALDFGTAESDPDRVVAPIVYRNQLFITGQTTIEGFQNQGGADFPFVRSGLFFDKGVFAPLSLINTQDSFMFIGGGVNESPAVWAAVGNGIQKISTNAIDALLQDLTTLQVSSIFAWTYAQKGSYFVGFGLPDTCIVFDMTAKRWHERKSYINSVEVAYRVRTMQTAYGKIVCGDIRDGRIGHLNPDSFSEYDGNIIHTIVTQPFQNSMKSIAVPYIELTVQSGVGNSDDPDPVVIMDRSTNGRTFKAPRQRKMGKIGEDDRRAIWKRNGRASRFESFRFRHSDKTKFVAIQLTGYIIGNEK